MALRIPSNIASLSTSNLIESSKAQLMGKISPSAQPVISTVDILRNKLNSLKTKIETTKKEYDRSFEQLQTNFKAGYINEEELNQKYNQFKEQLKVELELIQEEIKVIEKNIKETVIGVESFFKNIKEEKKKLKEKINNNIKNAKKSLSLANKERNLKVLKNLQKSLGPIIINQLTNVLIKIVDKTAQLQELVNKTNEIIDNANTLEKINQARISRSSALNILNNQEKKLVTVRNIIQTIQKTINILNIIIRTIQIILRLGSPIPIPLPVKIKLQPILQRILKLISELSVALTIINSIIINLITNIENLKAQLHQIGTLIDIKTTNPLSTVTINQLGGFLGNIRPDDPTAFPTYKGFRFAIREENNPKFVVRGFKRHYAVAIDTNNVEVLKSEYSFTLDPQDLIDTLKIIIDKNNLSAEGNIAYFNQANIEGGGEESITDIFNEVNNIPIISPSPEDFEGIPFDSSITTTNISPSSNTTPPSLTPQQKEYYAKIAINPLKSKTERDNARAILQRNYV